MNTKALTAECRLTHWAQLMRERCESGLNIRTFCKQAGIHENTYYYWQRKLREATLDQMTAMMSSNSHTKATASSFTEVRVVKAPSQPAFLETNATGSLRMGAGDIHIIADSAYPAEKLVMLLRELKPSC